MDAVDPVVEVWLPVLGFSWEYEVSNHGRVRSWTTTSGQRRAKPYLLALNRNGGGRRVVNLAKKTRLVHQLVLEAFVGPRPAGMESFHEDDNPNNNHIENLRWATHADNCRHKIVTGRNGAVRGADHGCAKLTPELAQELRAMRRAGASYSELRAKFSVGTSTVYNVLSGRSWRVAGCQ